MEDVVSRTERRVETYVHPNGTIKAIITWMTHEDYNPRGYLATVSLYENNDDDDKLLMTYDLNTIDSFKDWINIKDEV